MREGNWWTTPDGVQFQVGNENKLKVKFKKLSKYAIAPSYAKDGDAGLDLTAYTLTDLKSEPFIEYGTGIAMEIPQGYVGLVFPRSSVSKKENFYLKNSVGVIDSGYRGEIKLRFNRSEDRYEVGEKVGQLIIIPYPTIYLEEVEELSSTERGEGGFGSTGI